eukprot:scaffold31102_cov19-Tisochrysis_lutea.AAC.1
MRTRCCQRLKQWPSLPLPLHPLLYHRAQSMYPLCLTTSASELAASAAPGVSSMSSAALRGNSTDAAAKLPRDAHEKLLSQCLEALRAAISLHAA